MGDSQSSSTKPDPESVRPMAIDEKLLAEALEIARETEEGEPDAEVRRILTESLTELWRKIEAQPESYIMTRTEMSLFTYMQYNYQGDKLAIAARRRYWENIGRAA